MRIAHLNAGRSRGRVFGLAFCFSGVLSLASACELLEGDGNWARFNRENERLVIQITSLPASEEVGELSLRSSTGAVEVATARVDPLSGPVGTEHAVVVSVLGAYWENVDRVTVDADAGERGLERFELVRDSADAGHWQVDLTSSGAAGEVREDRLSFGLWTAVPRSEAEDDSPESGDTED